MIFKDPLARDKPTYFIKLLVIIRYYLKYVIPVLYVWRVFVNVHEGVCVCMCLCVCVYVYVWVSVCIVAFAWLCIDSQCECMSVWEWFQLLIYTNLFLFYFFHYKNLHIYFHISRECVKVWKCEVIEPPLESICY